MDIAKELKKIMIDRDVTLSVLADKLGTSQPNLSHKFKRNNFSITEMLEIATALDYELKIEFIKK